MATEALSGRKMASSFAWSSLENGGAQLAQIAVFFIAARILAPEDIGRASLALVIVQAFQSIVAASINGTIVSAPAEACEAITTAASRLVLALGAMQLALVIVAGAAFVAAGGTLSVAGLFVVPALANLCLALGAAHQARLTRALAMRALAMRTLISVGVAGCCGIALAVLKCGAYAIVLQALIQAATGTALLRYFSPWRPVLRVTAADYRAVLRFARHLFATGTLNFVVGNADLVIVGAVLGVRAAGIYAVARRALFAANGLISTALYQVSLSIFSRLQDTPRELDRQFLALIASTSLITVPLFFAAVGLADPLVQLCFGARWIEAAPVMMILMPAGALQSLGIYNQAVAVATGRPHLQTRLALANAAVAIPVLIVMAPHGTIAVATGYTLATYLVYPASIAVVARSSGVTIGRYLFAIAPAFASGAVAGLAAYVAQHLTGPSPLIRLGAAAAAGALGYCVVTMTLARATVFSALGTILTRPAPTAKNAPATGGPPISVVIALYNKRADIADTIASVLRQTHADFELIVIDDGSTDRGGEVVAGFADPRIRLMRQDNQGAAAARNAGWQMAAHAHVAFLDGDDLWDADYLATIARLIGDFPQCAAYATSYRRDRGGAIAATRLHHGLTRGVMPAYFIAATKGQQPFFTSTVCVRRDALARLGGFARGVSHGEDLDLWGRIALHHTIAFDPVPKGTYRMSATNRAMHRCPPLGWHFRVSAREFRAQHPGRAMPPGLDRHIDHIELYHAALNRPHTPGADIRKALRVIRWRHFPLRKARIWVASVLAGSGGPFVRLTALAIVAGGSLAPHAADPAPAMWFSAQSPWNMPIGAAPLAPYSAAALHRYLARGHSVNMNWGSAGVYVLYPGAGARTMALPFYSGGGIRWHIPDAPITPDLIAAATYRLARHNTDGMTCVVDTPHNRLLSFWQPRPSADGIAITTGGITPMTGVGWSRIGPQLPSPGRAAGASYCGGLIREAEMRHGEIRHALALAWTKDLIRAPGSPWGAVQYPATVSDGTDTITPASIPMGARIQLDPALSDTALVALGLALPADLVIAHALQRYGGYVVDSNSATMGGSIYFESRQDNGDAVYAATNPWPLAVIARMRFVVPPRSVPLDTQAPARDTPAR
ncbi:oligosaccharide flippase family protein [Novosphingobium sp.]|uniref:oligosaccharide flippase family protein n=1 Tax=Novosphingobium sp. TaxID=1874826 RepID=UPI003D097005